uniref:Uncharacterized protein n=1 Tax=Arundo donax TaxID=35708 RepID=A0A0A9B780_ARUDO
MSCSYFLLKEASNILEPSI